MTDRAPAPAPQTRGFLFADLRGYSKFTDEHGDAAAADLIGRYRELVRSEIATFHGAEIRTEGDSFYVVFSSVSEAVQAGVAIRDAAGTASAGPGATPIHVGIGIHAGESTDGSQGIISAAVNIAARVCGVAEPGEVLVTDTVRSLTRSFLPIGFTARGRRRLKGIAEPIALFAVSPSASEQRPAARTRGPRFAIAGAFLAGIVVIVAVALTLRGPAATGGPPAASPAASPTAFEPEETHDLGRFTDPGEFPNVEETALIEKLATGLTPSCDRADPSTYPGHYFAETVGGIARFDPLNIRAGITCLTGGNSATYLQVGSQRSEELNYAEEAFFNAILRRSIEEGSCSETTRAYSAWTSGAHTGHVMCFMREGEAVLEWTYPEPNIYAIATRRDGDLAALYAWWEDVGRRLSR